MSNKYQIRGDVEVLVGDVVTEHLCETLRDLVVRLRPRTGEATSVPPRLRVNLELDGLYSQSIEWFEWLLRQLAIRSGKASRLLRCRGGKPEEPVWLGQPELVQAALAAARVAELRAFLQRWPADEARAALEKVAVEMNPF